MFHHPVFRTLVAAILTTLSVGLPLEANPGPAAPLAITGSVTGPNGAPVVGAVVVASKYVWMGERAEGQPLVRTQTDARGHFRFAGLNPERRDFNLLVGAFAPGTTLETETATREHPSVRLHLEPETRLPVQVVDTRGTPVPNVRLRVDSVRMRVRLPVPDARRRAHLYQYDALTSALLGSPSDARGRIVLSHLPRGAELKLLTDDHDWIQAERPLEPILVKLGRGADTPEWRLRVRRAARVSGRLITGSDVGVAGWHIYTADSPRLQTTVTGPRGEFSFAGLTEGHHAFRVWGQPNSRFVCPPDFSVLLREGENRRDLRVICPEGALVRLRVVRAEDGAPVPNCRIRFTSPGNDVSDAEGTTGADGCFVQRQREGVWYISLAMPPEDAEQYEFEPQDDYQRLNKTWTATNGEVQNLGDFRVHLHSKSVIRGRIYRRDGSPAAGATVYYPLEGEMRYSLEWTPHVTTRADGSFETPPLDPRPEERHEIYASLGDRWTAGPFELDVHLGNDAEVQQQLTDTPLAILRGSVVDDLGKPVSHAIIAVGDGSGLMGNTIPPMPRTGTDGRFTLRLWPEVEYTVFAAAEKHDWAQSPGVKLVSGRNGELAALVLRRATSQLRLRVVDERGRPRPRISLSITREDPRSQVPPYMLSILEATDERGLFFQNEVLPGTYRVEVADSMHLVNATVEAGKLATVVLKRH